GYYLGYRSASGGIVIEADREPSENVTAAADTDDLDRYFEPEGEETKENANSRVLLDINKATEEELDALPGIGKATARKIIEYRELYGSFLDKEEIKAVEGIGDGTYRKIKELITVS
ncbi:MAG: helix-hairpin-helix domain-containing protein, partial [Bacillota bacterium]|nr:helix-hairpin-helix domain-containing protein [Bacillota bacterium]